MGGFRLLMKRQSCCSSSQPACYIPLCHGLLLHVIVSDASLACKVFVAILQAGQFCRKPRSPQAATSNVFLNHSCYEKSPN